MFVSDEVVNQSGEDDVGLISEKSHRPASHPVQTLLHNPEHMLHPRPDLCVLPVDGVLPLADFFASDISFDDSVLQAILPQHTLHALAYVCAVSVQLLPLVALVHQRACGLGVMIRGLGGHALLDELALDIHLRVALVAIVAVAALLHPARVGILVAFLVGLSLFILLCITRFLIPQFVPFIFLDKLVLLAACYAGAAPPRNSRQSSSPRSESCGCPPGICKIF